MPSRRRCRSAARCAATPRPSTGRLPVHSMPRPMSTKIGPSSLARNTDVCMNASCPFAGMTRIRFKGFPRHPGRSAVGIGELSAPYRSSPRNCR